ncbi:Detected protein of confused Function [Hibiscus syriacus]|uniref:Detected protein of confused Function n=1 Tax=Hibiscus syriacus TaxID=106335 RepID=A0A6A2ZAR0_HIBSY|nr:Detected protein of confused Function [Hibiscus syriacus]
MRLIITREDVFSLAECQKVLKGGYSASDVHFHEYLDLQERCSTKDQQISENFSVRGDGTVPCLLFSNEFLTSLFKEQGLDTEELGVGSKLYFAFQTNYTPSSEAPTKSDLFCEGNSQPKADAVPISDFVVDMSEGMAVEMFGVPTSNDNEVIKIELGGCDFKINVLSKEHQHTCKSTGLMLWESARLMAVILARNPIIVAGKRVLELGSGCESICSMVSAGSESIVTDDIDAIKDVIIIGKDVTCIPEAILPLFSTARELIASSISGEKGQAPALILCHIFR